MAQSYLRNPSVERLPVILEELHVGSLCIPPFQRDFEWTGEQRLALCSSVRLGLPTGALMVWRTSHKLAAENPIGPYHLAPSEASAPQYLLDGRQRMTTLYAALAASFWTREGKAPPLPASDVREAPDGTPWSILFDLEEQEFTFDHQSDAAETNPNLSLLPAGEDNKRALLPLAVLLDDTAYDEWRARTSLSREHTNRARALRSAFTDYLIPVVPLATDDIGVVTLTFKRVNNGGTPMGDADMTRALAWSKGFDLREKIEVVREELKPRGWGELEDDALLKVVAAVSNLDPTEVDPEQLAQKIKAHPALVHTAGERVASTVRLLGDRLGITGPGSLPYTQILVLVARALDRAGGSLKPAQENKLAAWAAEVCLDERFGGAPAHMIRADWRALAHRLGLPHADPPRARDEKLPKAKECWVFSMAWARSRGTALVLADQRPRDGQNRPFNDPFTLVARGSDNIGMLIAQGAEGVPVFIRRQAKHKHLSTALRSPANRVVCPPHELPELRAALLRGDCPVELLRSHLVDETAHEALVLGDLEEFFERRRTAILIAEKRWVEDRGGEVEILREPRTYAWR
ncbi:DUF262 domain-containing protein [Sorangium sp. So ce321]|uniref:DUF262 domain-containing protein n=1 Tax=Sorangium sp. So ce321 TaxID=3133300 RepID=UPI003F5D709F